MEKNIENLLFTLSEGASIERIQKRSLNGIQIDSNDGYQRRA